VVSGWLRLGGVTHGRLVVGGATVVVTPIVEGGAVGPVKRHAEVWERSRTVRRLNELWLDHVAFVPNPASETAVVLDVRGAAKTVTVATATPNRDRFELDRLMALKAEIDARYGVV
jgi:hypothetical protein